MKKINFILIFSLLSFYAFSQINPLKVKCIGGSKNDHAYCFYPMNDGTFVFAGSSQSFDGDLDTNSGQSDCWFMHLDTSFNILNNVSFGEAQFDYINDIHIMSDTSFIFLINSNSNTGIFSSNNGNSDAFIRTYYTGTNWMSPAFNYGGSLSDIARHISPKAVNGYLVCGSSQSSDGSLTHNYGNSDFWVMSLTSTFNVAWSKNYGGTNTDNALKVYQLSDGNIMVFGNTSSNDNMVIGNKGLRDVWVIKLNSMGDTLWTKCYGGTGVEEISNVVPIGNDQFALVGWSNSLNGDFFYMKNDKEKLSYVYSFYHVIDSNGDFVLGGNKLITDNDVFFSDIIYSCSQDIDVFGYIDSNPHMDTTDYDIYMLNYNNGVVIRTDTFGGNETDGYNFLRAHKLNQTDFLVISATYSDDLANYHGEYDVLLAILQRYTPTGISENKMSAINIYPNPSTKRIYISNLPHQGNWKCYITDITGKNVLTDAPFTDAGIDVSTLSEGMYILTVSDGSVALAKRIVIAK